VRHVVLPRHRGDALQHALDDVRLDAGALDRAADVKPQVCVQTSVRSASR
jgi:hypothetical protein